MPERHDAAAVCIPRDATVLGFDVGARRIGVAVGSALGSGARGIAVIDVHDDREGRGRVIRRRSVVGCIAAKELAQPGIVLNAPQGAARFEDVVEIRVLLEGLTPERRDALVLTQVLGLSYDEAAEVCGCPLGTIRSRVARARDDLIAADRRDDLTG